MRFLDSLGDLILVSGVGADGDRPHPEPIAVLAMASAASREPR
jgi:hypothetical protein